MRKSLKIIRQDNFDLNSFIDENKAIINSHLEIYLKELYPFNLWKSMRYTTLADGKRIRPILALESARACKGNVEEVIPTACAIEMFHAQSLIHDDLPCMDDDDYRRGQKTNHKVFGEATAVLAGDALLTYAPLVIIRNTPKSVNKEDLLKVIEEYCETAGPFGLVGGQVVDIESEGNVVDLPTFTYIHTHKTGDLIKFAVRAGAILAKAKTEQLEALTKYGELIGYAFQIADDILDKIATKKELGKTPGKDEKKQKATHPSLYGLAQSREEVVHLCASAQNLLIVNGLNTQGLIGLAGSIALKVIDRG